jgi:hypothetical protein
MSFARATDFDSTFFGSGGQSYRPAPSGGGFGGYGGGKKWGMQSIPQSSRQPPQMQNPGFAPLPNGGFSGSPSIVSPGSGPSFGTGSSNPGLSGLEGEGSSPGGLSPANTSGQAGGYGVAGNGGSGLPGPFAFDDGGSMPDTGGNNDLVSMALSTIDSALQYGRQKFGINQGQQQPEPAPGGGHDSWQDMRQSGNVDDRRDESQLGNTLMSPAVNTYGNAYSLYDRGMNALGMGDNGDAQRDNPMSQAAGINDIDKSKGLQGLGEDGTLDDTAGGQ